MIKIEIADRIKASRVYPERLPERNNSRWYVANVDGDLVGCACLWEPRNRQSTLRMSHCFVQEEYRGHAVGERLVFRRYRDAHKTNKDFLDTYARNPGLFNQIGFEEKERYSETVYLKKELNGKIYSRQDVLSAARERIGYVFEKFDNIYLSVSGGKDSSVGLQICSEVAEEMGRTFDVLFIDLEAQYKMTINHFEDLIENNRNHIGRVYWTCLPFSLRNAVSQLQPKWTCWNPEKKGLWVRDMPENEFVINQQNNPFEFFYRDMEFEEFVDKFGVWYDENHTGSTAAGIFIRSNESFNRFRSLTSETKITHKGKQWTTKLRINDTYYDVYNFYPIYDWQVEDVWGYVSRYDKPYNDVYDYMWKNGVPLSDQRICQPYGDDQRQGLDQFRAIEPETWEKILNRVSGVNFGNIYARTSLLGHLDSEKPDHLSWQEYAVFLLETLEIYCPELRGHYTDKITTFLHWYEDAEYEDTGWTKKMGIEDIPDNHPDDLPKSGYPSWERIAWALERNDFWMGRLGFAPTKGAKEKLERLRQKYGDSLIDTACTDDVNLERFANGTD